MDFAWGFAKKWNIRPVEENLFVLQVSCLGDWNRAMQDGPWIFRQQGVLLEPYDGIADPKSIKLNRLHAWVQVRGTPPLFRKEELVRDMAARIGDVLDVDLYALGASGTSFVRVRVKLDVFKPLTRFVGLHPEGSERMSFQVMYEKLPKFCDICGLFGHGDVECGDGVHAEADKQYGAWMTAPMEDWHPQTTGLRVRAPTREEYRGGGAPGRGGGRGGRGVMDSRKRPQGESPNAVEKEYPPGLQITDRAERVGDRNKPNVVKNLAQAFGEEKGSDDKGNPSPVKPDPKRMRKGGDHTEEAGPEEGRRQPQ
ncbi:hypothetical protein QYE76_019346 [Lolium multiflorum]|uniref:Zinc knuckle CX2CX4HX4C domain-containing protein n=1 Tax=Lolium multiflorum TaxID=4521 RepID=A0AAD8R6C4_LOLMU|nr:hypothetical protein QYE76_019346 [Lolium multiflorum]